MPGALLFRGGEEEKKKRRGKRNLSGGSHRQDSTVQGSIDLSQASMQKAPHLLGLQRLRRATRKATKRKAEKRDLQANVFALCEKEV